MTRWSAAPALVVALLSLAACSTASLPSSTSLPSSATAGSGTAAPATPSGTTGIRSTPSSSSAGDPYPAAEACAYLQGQIPVLTAIDSPVGREANLAANLFTFFSDHAIVPDGARLDAATTTQCPDVRSQLLTLTGLTSLAAL